ncbi:MAG: tripartite tricarboxylate transporter TctB family protein [Pseudomonadota bacterium]
MIKADTIVAGALMAFSVYLMSHATVLPIWWVPEAGPGGGAFPFWLSLGMFLASGMVLVRSLKDQVVGPFFDPETWHLVAWTSVMVLATIGIMVWAGAYVALPIFMIVYLRWMGGHGWFLISTLTTGTALFMFFFFEVTLKILLPKGITEPLFIPLYAIFF